MSFWVSSLSSAAPLDSEVDKLIVLLSLTDSLDSEGSLKEKLLFYCGGQCTKLGC